MFAVPLSFTVSMPRLILEGRSGLGFRRISRKIFRLVALSAVCSLYPRASLYMLQKVVCPCKGFYTTKAEVINLKRWILRAPP